MLDCAVSVSPAKAAWLRVERQVALAAATREAGGEAALDGILCARMGAKLPRRGEAGLAALQARASLWREVAQRKGSPALRGLVRGLAPVRGDRDLVALGDNVLTALGQCSRSDWSWEKDAEGRRTIIISASDPALPDVGDLAMALPYALRRAGFTRQLLPSLTGRPKLLGRPGEPLDRFVAWLSTITRQAEEAQARLRLLERHLAFVTRALAGVRRPAALQRAVAVSLGRWSLWAAQLARITGTDISSAFRCLEQAADLGLIVQVPVERRSRGNATLYAAPPWLTLAGLISVPRGRPARVPAAELVSSGGLTAAMAEIDALLAGMDEILGQQLVPGAGLSVSREQLVKPQHEMAGDAGEHLVQFAGEFYAAACKPTPT